jgi:curli biogenesis system outer membrane secretion channel CsgG
MQQLRLIHCAVAALVAFGAGAPAFAEDVRDKEQRGEAQIPVCTHKIGTLAVHEPDNHWWEGYGLESPEALIKVFVMRSGCFTMVDRGKGLQAVQQERALAGEGDLQQGSNMGRGQIKAADYVLVPDIVSQNGNAGGTNIGGMLGGLIGHGAGAILGGINISKKTADVVLTITNVRTTEQEAMEEGHADKTDVGFGIGGGGGTWSGFGAAGASSYANTDIGQVVTLAYLQAYTKLVGDLGGLQGGAAAPQQAVTMARPGNLRVNPSEKAKIVRSLSIGMMLYPTGNKDGIWWEVTDELGNKGWVSSALLQLAK